jgi:hypothetical protein
MASNYNPSSCCQYANLILCSPSTGSQRVTVTGSAFGNLASRLACIFNASSVPFTFVSDSALICLSPARSKGTIIPVRIMYDNGTFFSNSIDYGYYGGMRISPSIGPFKGGTSINIQSAVLTCTKSGACLRGPDEPAETQSVACRFNFIGIEYAEDTQGLILTQDKIKVVSCKVPRANSSLGSISSLSYSQLGFNNTNGLGSHLVGALVSFTLLGPDAFTDPADALLFVFYPDPVVESIVPTFASGAGGCTSTIFGTGFLPFPGQRLRFAGNESISEWSPAQYVSPGMMIANVSKRCISRQQESCERSPLFLQPSVSLSVNGQQYSGNSIGFRYYDVLNIVPSGGRMEGGTPLTVYGSGFDLIQAGTPVKCRFSHNFVEGPATLLSSSSVFCISPQGRQTSSVEVCIGTNYSLTNPELVGCRNSYTSNHAIFVSYSIFPEIIIRPDSGPSIGGFQVTVSLDSSVYSSLQLSEEIFRVYAYADQVRCKFAGVEAAATLVSTTRVLCIAPPYTAMNDEFAGNNLVQITLNGWDWSQTSLYLRYQIVTDIEPFGSPATCTEPICQTGRLVCDWCTVQPNIDTQVGTCQTWEPAFVNGFRVTPTSITVTGINLDQFVPSRNVEGGFPYPLCKLGSLNIFNASFVAGDPKIVNGQIVSTLQLTCPLPIRIHMAVDETPAMIMEVSLNGRDFTSSSAARKSAAVWSTRVRSFCPPIVIRMRPSSGTSASAQMALVTLQGLGFTGSFPVTDGVNLYAKCKFGWYPPSPATVLSDTQMVCTAPVHPVPESLPVSITLNSDIYLPFPSVTFTYMKLNWIVPSTGPVEGGTVISLFGDNLLAIVAGTSNFSTSYFCRFGGTIVPGSFQRKLDSVSVDPKTGSFNTVQMYFTSQMCHVDYYVAYHFYLLSIESTYLPCL